MSTLWVNFKVRGMHALNGDFLHIGDELGHLELILRQCCVQIPLKLAVRDLITGLESSVVVTILLDGIISEMHERVIEIVECEYFGARS